MTANVLKSEIDSLKREIAEIETVLEHKIGLRDLFVLAIRETPTDTGELGPVQPKVYETRISATKASIVLVFLKEGLEEILARFEDLYENH